MEKILLLILLLLSFNTYSEEKEINRYDFYLFGGAGAGISSLQTNFKNEIVEEANKLGYRLNLDVVPSYYWDKWVVDLGMGWFHSKFEDTRNNNVIIRFKTNTIYMEFSPRYRINTKWSIGPFYTAILGKKLILGATESVTNADSDETASQLGGISLFRDINGKSRPERFYVKLERSLDVEDRELTTVLAGYQWSWGKYKPIIKNPTLKIELSKNFINFETDSDKLDSRSKRILKEISHFLQQNLDSWTKIVVAGHTDSIGDKIYNNYLSTKRAHAVHKELKNNGLDKKRTYSDGYGEEVPLASNATPEGRSANRRVELEFLGATDDYKIQKFISELVQREKDRESN